MPLQAAANARPSPELFRDMLDRLPIAAYACDAEGLITYFNDKAAETWGRAPKLNHVDDRFCGSYRLFATDGTPIAHDECWMALALKNRREYLAQDILVERPNAALVPVLAYATPLFDEGGALVAGINMLVDISERKRMERLLRNANETKNQYMSTLADELRLQLASMQQALARVEDGAAATSSGGDALAQVHARMREMVQLIDDLLDVPHEAEAADRLPPLLSVVSDRR